MSSINAKKIDLASEYKGRIAVANVAHALNEDTPEAGAQRQQLAECYHSAHVHEQPSKFDVAKDIAAYTEIGEAFSRTRCPSYPRDNGNSIDPLYRKRLALLEFRASQAAVYAQVYHLAAMADAGKFDLDQIETHQTQVAFVASDLATECRVTPDAGEVRIAFGTLPFAEFQKTEYGERRVDLWPALEQAHVEVLASSLPPITDKESFQNEMTRRLKAVAERAMTIDARLWG